MYVELQCLIYERIGNSDLRYKEVCFNVKDREQCFLIELEGWCGEVFGDGVDILLWEL